GDARRGAVVAARGIYLDSSALVKLVVTEAESAALRGYLAAELPRVTSRIAEVEVTRAVRRVAQPGDEAQASAVLAGLRFLELDASTSAAACSVGPSTLRSMDAIHLASALALAPELRAFVTYDLRLADA